MTDIESLVALGEGITLGPWSYRPLEYDDWGYVRGAPSNGRGNGGIICQARDPERLDEEILNEYRRAGTDPWEANARAISAVPDLIAAIRTLQTEKVELREAVKTAKGAIETLDVGGLGWGEQPHETLGVNVYPLRDELLAALDQTLSNTGEME